MKLLRAYMNSQWFLYQLQQGHWQMEKMYQLKGQTALYQFLLNLPCTLDLALIPLNSLYRNTFYVTCPQVKLIILPYELYHYVMQGHYMAAVTQSELAISLAYTPKEEVDEAWRFLDQFYQCKNLASAQTYYATWQLNRDLTDVLANRIQRVMQIFEEEIMNYFIYRSLIEIE